MMGGKRIDRTGAAPGQMGMVFQQFNLISHLTALENITLAPRLVRKLNRRAAEERAGATPKDGPGGQGRRKTRADSGGQQHLEPDALGSARHHHRLSAQTQVHVSLHFRGGGA